MNAAICSLVSRVQDLRRPECRCSVIGDVPAVALPARAPRSDRRPCGHVASAQSGDPGAQPLPLDRNVGEPVSTPDQIGGRLSPEYALGSSASPLPARCFGAVLATSADARSLGESDEALALSQIGR